MKENLSERWYKCADKGSLKNNKGFFWGGILKLLPLQYVYC
jgi:hypothetical protein